MDLAFFPPLLWIFAGLPASAFSKEGIGVTTSVWCRRVDPGASHFTTVLGSVLPALLTQVWAGCGSGQPLASPFPESITGKRLDHSLVPIALLQWDMRLLLRLVLAEQSSNGKSHGLSAL